MFSRGYFKPEGADGTIEPDWKQGTTTDGEGERAGVRYAGGTTAADGKSLYQARARGSNARSDFDVDVHFPGW